MSNNYKIIKYIVTIVTDCLFNVVVFICNTRLSIEYSFVQFYYYQKQLNYKIQESGGQYGGGNAM